jgi:hypothetical protein
MRYLNCKNLKSNSIFVDYCKRCIPCLSIIYDVEEREDSSWNGLLQSQNWPVGFGPSGEIVVWDKDGDNLFPLDICHPSKEIDE